MTGKLSVQLYGPGVYQPLPGHIRTAEMLDEKLVSLFQLEPTGADYLLSLYT